MPTFTKIAWETLLEPTLHKTPSNPPPSVVNTDSGDYADDVNKKRAQKAPNHIYISPALYITPAPAPIPASSSDPVSPSPYVVNHKRRGRDVAVRAREVGSDSNSNLGLDLDLSSSGDCGDEVVVGEVVVEEEEKLFGVGGEDRNGTNGGCEEVVEDDFLDPRCDVVSVGSLTEGEEFGKQVAECRSVVSNQGEFFDADEDFSSDGSMSNLSSSYGPRMESELRAARFSLLEEIERRKTAEQAVAQMYSQWQRLASLLSQTGLTFPIPNATSMQLEIDCLEQCCQELEVTRFVAEAIGRGQARAEAEIAAEFIIESKDQEISRLRDKLQYYEAVNHEMSQRNQEVMEVARRQRQRRKNQRKWIWGCIGLSVAIGTSVIAYSYLPHKHHALPASSDSSDASYISPAASGDSSDASFISPAESV